jgi:hypothetical protein
MKIKIDNHANGIGTANYGPISTGCCSIQIGRWYVALFHDGTTSIRRSCRDAVKVDIYPYPESELANSVYGAQRVTFSSNGMLP